EPAYGRHEREVFFGGELVVEGRFLGGIPEPTLGLQRLAPDIEVLDRHRPRIRRLQSGCGPQQSALAGAVGAEQAYDLSALDLQGYPGEGDQRAVMARQVTDLEHHASSNRDQ